MTYNKSKLLASTFSILASVGTVATAVLSAKAAKQCESGKINKEKIKKDIKKFIPTIVVGSITISLIVSSNVISKKVEASLAASVIALSQGYNKYKSKIIEKIGENEHQQIVASIDEDTIKPSKDDGTKLYHNEYIGFFRAKPEKVTEAFYNMNMRINAENVNGYGKNYEKGWCTLEQFVKDTDATCYDETKFKLCKDFGWNVEWLIESEEDSWIYYGINDGPDKVTDCGEHYTELVFMTSEPIFDPSNLYEFRHIFKNDNKGENN